MAGIYLYCLWSSQVGHHYPHFTDEDPGSETFSSLPKLSLPDVLEVGVMGLTLRRSLLRLEGPILQ